MTKSLFILEDCAMSLEDYELIITEVNYRFSEGTIHSTTKDAILKRVKEKIEELKSEEHN